MPAAVTSGMCRPRWAVIGTFWQVGNVSGRADCGNFRNDGRSRGLHVERLM